MAIIRRRIVIIGERGSGKTSLAKGFDDFGRSPAYDNEVSHLKALTNYKNPKCHIDFEYFFAPDVCGSLFAISEALSQAVGILVCYDLSTSLGFYNMRKYVREIPEDYKRDKIYILVGMKVDKIWMYGRNCEFLEDERRRFVESEKFDGVFDVSSKEGMNIDKLMLCISETFLKKFWPTNFEKHKFWRIWRKIMYKIRTAKIDNF